MVAGRGENRHERPGKAKNKCPGDGVMAVRSGDFRECIHGCSFDECMAKWVSSANFRDAFGMHLRYAYVLVNMSVDKVKCQSARSALYNSAGFRSRVEVCG